MNEKWGIAKIRNVLSDPNDTEDILRIYGLPL